MSEAAVAGDQAGDVRVSGVGTLRRLTLNRPKALNALTRGMAETMTRCLQSWAADPGVGAVLIDGAGDRGLCAGGDLRALYDAAKAKTPLPAQFWSTEYRLNVLIARYAKPVIAVMDGVVMGGGVGISLPARYRIATERTTFAMPEAGIGLFPDVGSGRYLSRLHGKTGAWLALTGARPPRRRPCSRSGRGCRRRRRNRGRRHGRSAPRARPDRPATQ